MHQIDWQVKLGAALVVLSGVIFGLHVVIFGDAYHVAYYLLMDIVFIPIEVLFVTLILNQLLTSRDKRQLLNKLNMVIGAFFSEVGTPLLRGFPEFCPDAAEIGPNLIVKESWGDAEFHHAAQWLLTRKLAIRSENADLVALKSFLTDRRDFLLRLLENPNLLEHEAFTEVLWAVFHLTEELTSRSDLHGLPANDYDHLSGDINRVYSSLIREWLGYMNHLRQYYPYLYSLARRTNPFNPNASAEVA